MGLHNSKDSNAKKGQPRNAGGGGKNGGKQQGGGITELDRAKLQLKLQREKLVAHEKKLSSVQQMERSAAVRLVKEGKKDKALYCLRRSKAQEAAIARVQAHYDNIQTLIDTVDATELNQKVGVALREGTTALNTLNTAMSVGDLEKIVDDASDAIHVSKEVSDLLGECLDPQAEDAAEEELQAMITEQQQQQKAMTSPPVDHSVGDLQVPQHAVDQTGTKQPEHAANDGDDALRNLTVPCEAVGDPLPAHEQKKEVDEEEELAAA